MYIPPIVLGIFLVIGLILYGIYSVEKSEKEYQEKKVEEKRKQELREKEEKQKELDTFNKYIRDIKLVFNCDDERAKEFYLVLKTVYSIEEFYDAEYLEKKKLIYSEALEFFNIYEKHIQPVLIQNDITITCFQMTELKSDLINKKDIPFSTIAEQLVETFRNSKDSYYTNSNMQFLIDIASPAFKDDLKQIFDNTQEITIDQARNVLDLFVKKLNIAPHKILDDNAYNYFLRTSQGLELIPYSFCKLFAFAIFSEKYTVTFRQRQAINDLQSKFAFESWFDYLKWLLFSTISYDIKDFASVIDKHIDDYIAREGFVLDLYDETDDSWDSWNDESDE